MIDTTHIAYTAEDLISHKLQNAGLLVAKPKFDRDGTDFLALISVGNGLFANLKGDEFSNFATLEEPFNERQSQPVPCIGIRFYERWR
jgi:hypothetical protein